MKQTTRWPQPIPLAGPLCARRAKGFGCPHPSCATVRLSWRDPVAFWRRLRRWAHMLGFGGHFFTKSRTYSVTFAVLREQRIVHRRTETAGPDSSDQPTDTPTVLVVNFLEFVGAGWQTPADAMLANTSAAMAREHHEAALGDLAMLAA